MIRTGVIPYVGAVLLALTHAPSTLAAMQADFNQDGRTDLLWRNYATGENSIWLMDGTTPTAFLLTTRVDNLNWQMAGSGDFNGDRKPDILWRNYATGENSVWLMDGTEPTSFLSIREVTDPNWRMAGSGDFDGDGKADILWRNHTTGENSIWFMDGTTPTNFAVIRQVDDLNWQMAGSGDFNSDGKSDILWRNYATGDNSIWLMDGTTPTAFLVLRNVEDKNWQIAGGGDFNSDGKADILWRNYATGGNSIWAMDGADPTTFLSTQTVEDLHWRLPGEPQSQYERLARYWAPVISQDIDAADVRADYITTFDFDGDWDLGNNWDHLAGSALPAAVYYWVFESPERYFIGYGFFHPRDWTSADPARNPANAGQHVNDLEGALLSILKSREPYGRFEAMTTIAHGPMFDFADNDTPIASPWYETVKLSQSMSGEDEDLDFVADDVGLHPVVYMQAEGHGAYGHPLKGNDAWHYLDDWAPIFISNKVTDWRTANWSDTPAPPVSGDVSRYHDTGSWGDGVVYHYEAQPDMIGPAGVTSASALPHNWQVAGYALRSIKELWDRRFDEQVLHDRGQFAPRGQRGGADAPWAWKDNFFIDPAGFMAGRYGSWSGTAPQSCGYTGNSFGAAAQGCPEP